MDCNDCIPPGSGKLPGRALALRMPLQAMVKAKNSSFPLGPQAAIFNFLPTNSATDPERAVRRKEKRLSPLRQIHSQADKYMTLGQLAIVFQALYLAAQGRLRQVQLVCRPAKAPVSGDSGEISQVPKFH